MTHLQMLEGVSLRPCAHVPLWVMTPASPWQEGGSPTRPGEWAPRLRAFMSAPSQAWPHKALDSISGW